MKNSHIFHAPQISDKNTVASTAAALGEAEDDIRARFILESQVSKTISQTEIYGNNNNNKVKFTI